MLTGPQQMPVFDDEVLTPDDKRAIIGYLEALHSATHGRRLRPWRSRPGERGSLGLDHRSG
jgi:hypothetical protein